jgi:hypothetical protein
LQISNPQPAAHCSVAAASVANNVLLGMSGSLVTAREPCKGKSEALFDFGCRGRLGIAFEESDS